jgi:hypothetical protein
MIATAHDTLDPKPLIVTKDVAARMLSIDPRTLQRWTTPNGSLPCIRFGTGKKPLLRYRVADLEAFIAQHQEGIAP